MFSSFAGNLGPASGGSLDTFLKRFDTGAVTLLFAAPSGFANDNSQRPAIGSDGTLACFDSAASNLVSATDGNGTLDVFCSTLP